MANDFQGPDLAMELARVRDQNSKLVSAVIAVTIGSAIMIGVGLTSFFKKPAPERVAVQPNGRVFPIQSLTAGDPPDSKVTGFVKDCIRDLLNQPFTNYQVGVEKAIGGCFTGGGSESVRKAMDPLLEAMKSKKMELSSSFDIFPFINKRWIEAGGGGAYRVYNVQAVVEIGYRGQTNSTKPIQYVLEGDVIRVPYDSHIEGLRLRNVVLKLYNGGN